MPNMDNNNQIVFIVLLSITLVASSADIPGFIHPCEEMSPECLKTSIQYAIPHFVRGLPDLDIETMDPFKVESLQLALPGGLKIGFSKGVCKGFKNCKVRSANMVADTLDVSLLCNLTIKGKYKSSGRMLVFPIDGDGDSLIKCRNLNIRLHMKLNSMMAEDGETYLQVNKFKSEHSYEGQVMYRMTNLFKNSPEISKTVLEFMNNNWKLVAEEFGDPIVDFGITNILKNVKKLFKEIPLRKLLKRTSL